MQLILITGAQKSGKSRYAEQRAELGAQWGTLQRGAVLAPNPDTTIAFTERTRLFALARSSWADYDASLISQTNCGTALTSASR